MLYVLYVLPMYIAQKKNVMQKHNEARFITALSSSQYRERIIYHLIQNATKRPLHYRAPLYNAMGFGKSYFCQIWWKYNTYKIM